MPTAPPRGGLRTAASHPAGGSRLSPLHCWYLEQWEALVGGSEPSGSSPGRRGLRTLPQPALRVPEGHRPAWVMPAGCSSLDDRTVLLCFI